MVHKQTNSTLVQSLILIYFFLTPYMYFNLKYLRVLPYFITMNDVVLIHRFYNTIHLFWTVLYSVQYNKVNMFYGSYPTGYVNLSSDYKPSPTPVSLYLLTKYPCLKEKLNPVQNLELSSPPTFCNN